MHIENALCVKHRIEYLIKDIDDEDIRKKVIETKDRLARKYKKWAIYVFPNGSIHFIVNSEDEDIDFNKKLVMYKEAKEKSNGILIESEECLEKELEIARGSIHRIIPSIFSVMAKASSSNSAFPRT